MFSTISRIASQAYQQVSFDSQSLLTAVQAGNIEQIRSNLPLLTSIDDVTIEGIPLMVVALNLGPEHRATVIDKLLEWGASPDGKTQDGQSYLMWAANKIPTNEWTQEEVIEIMNLFPSGEWKQNLNPLIDFAIEHTLHTLFASLLKHTLTNPRFPVEGISQIFRIYRNDDGIQDKDAMVRGYVGAMLHTGKEQGASMTATLHEVIETGWKYFNENDLLILIESCFEQGAELSYVDFDEQNLLCRVLDLQEGGVYVYGPKVFQAFFSSGAVRKAYEKGGVDAAFFDLNLKMMVVARDGNKERVAPNDETVIQNSSGKWEEIGLSIQGGKLVDASD